jgi:hypothetical protein
VFVDIFQFHENPAENFQRPQFNHWFQFDSEKYFVSPLSDSTNF